VIKIFRELRWIDRLEQLNDFFGGLVIPANIRISQSRLFKHGCIEKEYDDIVGRGGEVLCLSTIIPHGRRLVVVVG